MTDITYQDIIKIPRYIDRLRCLAQAGKIGDRTFGGFRQLNQLLYQSPEWRAFRRDIIIRDDAFDLAHPDYRIASSIYIHHIQPLSIDDVRRRTSKVFDPDNVICCAFRTHNIIHYGSVDLLDLDGPVERKKGDTCLWK